MLGLKLKQGQHRGGCPVLSHERNVSRKEVGAHDT